MNKRSCKNCIFYDTCPDNHLCRHYSPTGDDEDYDSTMIELGRRQFDTEWKQYLAEAQPSDF